MERLASAGVEIGPEARAANSTKLSGKKFVLTGSLTSMSRDAAKEKIRELGGDAAESVRKKRIMSWRAPNLVRNMKRRKQLGVKILDEEEFLKLLR